MILATPFQPTKDSTLELSATPSIIKPILTSNASLDTPLEHGFTVRCDGEKYGHNPNFRDCEAAKEDLSPSTTIWTLGERNTGLPPETVPLPYRVMGGRGLCYVQPILVGDQKTGKASINMIRRAAAAIILQCVATGDSQGGIATNIGQSEARILAERLFAVSRTDLHPLADTCRW